MTTIEAYRVCDDLNEQVARFMQAGWYHKNPDGTTFPLKFVEA